MGDFKLVSIVDSVLEDITSEIILPVVTGTTSNVYQNQTAQAATGTNQMQFEIQIPSTETVMDRNVMIQTGLDLRVDFTGGTQPGYWKPNEPLFMYGQTNALQAFPLNSLVNSAQSQIQGDQVSVQTRDVMPALLKLYNYEELAKYNSLTPSLIDSFYMNYQDGLYSNNNVLSNYAVGGFAKEYQPRGVFPVELYTTDGRLITDASGNKVMSINADVSGNAPYSSIIVRFTTTEPLLFLSPFISGHSKNRAGFVGISKMNITLYLGEANRSMSNASYALLADGITSKETISNVYLSTYRDPLVLLNFKTMPATLADKIKPKNSLYYTQYQAYQQAVGTALPSKSVTTLTFNNQQLSQIPTKILIFVKKTQQTTYDSNSFMVIKNINVSFGTKDGALTGASQVQLFEMSARNGVQMNYYEYSGSGVSNTLQGGKPVEVPTIGSVLCIDPAIDLSLDEKYTNMSTGTYGLNFRIQVYNQSTEAVPVTIYAIAVNCGEFTTQNGVCQHQTAMLTNKMVLDTKMQDAVMDKNTYENEVTGGSIENINSLHKYMKHNFHKATEREHQLDHTIGHVVPSINEGSGMAAAGMSEQRRIRNYT